MHRRQHQRPAQQQGQQREPGNRHMHGQHEGQRLVQIVENPPPHAHRLDDGAEVVVEQHQRRGFSRHIGATPAHRDADMCGLQRGCVIDPIAGHRDDFALRFQGFDDQQFLLRLDACEHLASLHALLQFGRRHRGQQIASDHALLAGQQTGLGRNRGCGARVIAGDHQHPDACAMAFIDRRRYFWA